MAKWDLISIKEGQHLRIEIFIVFQNANDYELLSVYIHVYIYIYIYIHIHTLQIAICFFCERQAPLGTCREPKFPSISCWVGGGELVHEFQKYDQYFCRN